MKFRYKVVIINIILLSLGIGTVGFFMIRRNFQLALDAQIKTSIEENNLLQSTIEYRLLDTINSSPSNLVYQMKNLSADVVGKMGGNNKGVYVFYDGAEVVHSASDDNKLACPEELWSTAVIGQKQYMITKEAGRYYLFSCSTSLVQDKMMNIINARDITETYQLVETQRRYFVLLLGIVVFCCTVAVFAITYLLTKPLETLNRASKKFGEGDYESRVHLRSHDEVGTLAQTYNQMADAVCEHMDELQGMVTRQEQFVADFTHEVKTPMTTIIGYADMLRSKEMKRENQVLAASYIFHEGKLAESHCYGAKPVEVDEAYLKEHVYTIFDEGTLQQVKPYEVCSQQELANRQNQLLQRQQELQLQTDTENSSVHAIWEMVFSRIWKRRTGLQINGMSQWSQRKQERLFIHMRLQMESRRVLLAWMVKSMRSRMYIHVHIMTRMHILIPTCVTCGMICIRMKRKLQCGRKQRKMLWRGWI